MADAVVVLHLLALVKGKPVARHLRLEQDELAGGAEHVVTPLQQDLVAFMIVNVALDGEEEGCRDLIWGCAAQVSAMLQGFVGRVGDGDDD